MSNLDEDQLIKKFTPIVYFHEDEKYFPCSMDWILKNSTLIDGEEKISPVTNKDLMAKNIKYNFSRQGEGNLLLSFGRELYLGETPLTRVPCYAILRHLQDKIYINYVYLYAYNGEYKILSSAELGSHPFDIENVLFELNSNGELLRVLFSAHTSVDGRWVDKEELEFEKGQPVVYAAKHGHGLYPSARTTVRFFGFANDVTGKDIRWTPEAKRVYLKDDPKFDPDTMAWTAYYGRLGGARLGDTRGIMGMTDKDWVNDLPSVVKTSVSPPLIHVSPVLMQILAFFTNYIGWILGYLLVLFLSTHIGKNMPRKFAKYSAICIITILFILIVMYQNALKTIIYALVNE